MRYIIGCLLVGLTLCDPVLPGEPGEPGESGEPFTTGADEVQSSKVKQATQMQEIEAVITRPRSGYVMDKVLPVEPGNALHVHTLTKVMARGQEAKKAVFDKLLPYLMKELDTSQTKVLAALIPALEFTVYLRKIDGLVMTSVSNDPLELQKALLSELLKRIGQGYKLYELRKTITSLEGGTKGIDYDAISQQSKKAGFIQIYSRSFFRAELGDETFRELCDRLKKCGTQKKALSLNGMLDDIVRRKEKSIIHWQSLYAQIISLQSDSVKQEISKVLAGNSKGETLIPSTGEECCYVSGTISKLDEWAIHPAFHVIRPLFVWLVNYLSNESDTSVTSCFLNGNDTKITSKTLMCLKSYAMRLYYTRLVEFRCRYIGCQPLCNVKEGNIDNESEPTYQHMKKMMVDYSPEYLNSMVDLFSPLLSDVTASLRWEHRLGIIYTLLRCRRQGLVQDVLNTNSIGLDVLHNMYISMLPLTYSLGEYGSNNEEDIEEINDLKNKATCILKTLMLRMALFIKLVAQEGICDVDSETLRKAQSIIDNHKQLLKKALPRLKHITRAGSCSRNWDEDVYMDMVMDMDVDVGVDVGVDMDVDVDDASLNSGADESKAGESKEVLIPYYLLRFMPDDKYFTSPSVRSSDVITCEPEQLLMPIQKHFRAGPDFFHDSIYDDSRRERRCSKDNDKLIHDFLFTSRNLTFARPLNLSEKSLPVSYLFSGNESVCIRYPDIIDRLNNAYSHVVESSEQIEEYLLSVIKRLLLSAKKCKNVEKNIKEQIDEILLEKTLMNQLGVTSLTSLLHELKQSLPLIGSSTYSRQMIEYTACLIFYELGSESDKDRTNFKSVVRCLYSIQSRADILNFASNIWRRDCNGERKPYLDLYGPKMRSQSQSNRCKAGLVNCLKRGWGQPDGKQGERIRKALIKILEASVPDKNYKNIIDCFLEVIRPTTKAEFEIEAMADADADAGVGAGFAKKAETIALEKFGVVVPTKSRLEAIDVVKAEAKIEADTEYKTFMYKLIESMRDVREAMKDKQNTMFQRRLQTITLGGEASLRVLGNEIKSVLKQAEELCATYLSGVPPSGSPEKSAIGVSANINGESAYDPGGSVFNSLVRDYLRRELLLLLKNLTSWCRGIDNEDIPIPEHDIKEVKESISKISSCVLDFSREKSGVDREEKMQTNESFSSTKAWPAAWDTVKPVNSQLRKNLGTEKCDDETVENITKAFNDTLNTDRYEVSAVSAVSAKGHEENLKMAWKMIGFQEELFDMQHDFSFCGSSKDIFITHAKLRQTVDLIEQFKLCGYKIPPENLQNIVNYEIIPRETVLSEEDQELLATVQPLRQNKGFLTLLFQALNHRNIDLYKNSPALVAERISDLKEQVSETQRLEYTRLLSKALYYKDDPIACLEFSEVEAMQLKSMRFCHNESIRLLQQKKNDCENVVFPNLHVPPEGPTTHDQRLGCNQSLFSILQNMKFSYDADKSDFVVEECSLKGKEQLFSMMSNTSSADTVTSEHTSILDMIGKISSLTLKRKPIDCDPIYKTTTYNGVRVGEDYGEDHDADVLAKLERYKTQHKSEIEKEKGLLQDVVKSVEQINSMHSTRKLQLSQHQEELELLKAPGKDVQIQIGGEWFSYFDVLFAYNHFKQEYSYQYSFLTRRSSHKLNAIQKGIEQRMVTLSRAKTMEEDEKAWIRLASGCQSKGVDPNILPEIEKLIQCEFYCAEGEIDSKIEQLNSKIEAREKLREENLLKLRESESIQALNDSLQNEFDSQREETVKAQQKLFIKAFEYGLRLDESRSVHYILCSYLRKSTTTKYIESNIVDDYCKLKKAVPDKSDDIIDSPLLDKNPYMSKASLVFPIICVKGAYPLLDQLNNEKKICPYSMLAYGSGSPRQPLMSALILAAATGRYKACEALMKIVAASDADIDLVKQLLTVTSTDDKKNLLHHVVNFGKPELLTAFLEFLSEVSKSQTYDLDYDAECLQNRVALNRELLLKETLIVKDKDNMLPIDILLFRIGKNIKEWSKDIGSLYSYCTKFCVGKAKIMWRTVAEVHDVSQLYNAMTWFARGLGDCDSLDPIKKNQAEAFLRELVRMYRVHAPEGVYDAFILRAFAESKTNKT